MGTPSDDEKSIWPKYLPFTPIAMGMIQPEWIYMDHFFEEEEETMTPPIPIVRTSSAPAHSMIRINFRGRSSEWE